MEFSLVVLQGKSAGMNIPVKGPKFTIGRDKSCNLRPNQDLVSKNHCWFEVADEAVILRDLGSTNGTYVNGDRLLTPVKLKDGDQVRVGGLVFAVKIVGAAKTSAPQSHSSADEAFAWLMDDSSHDGAPAEPDGAADTAHEIELPTEEIEKAKLAAAASAPTEPARGLQPEQRSKKSVGGKPGDLTDTQAAAQSLLNKLFDRKRS